MEVTTVDDGLDAIRRLTLEPFDVIIADYRMPNIDGVKLLKLVARRFPSVRRILLSGHLVDGVDELVQSGLVHHYLQKPVEVDELLRCIRTAMRTTP